MANPFTISANVVTGTATSRNYPVTGPTAAGDTLCVIVGSNGTSGTVSACTDTAGNVYTLDQSFVTTLPIMYMYRSPGATGGSGGGATAALAAGNNITLTTAAVSSNIEISALSVPAGGAVDQTATIATGSSTSPTVSVTPTANNEVLIGGMVSANAGGLPAVTGGFFVTAIEQTGSNQYVTAAYKFVSGGSGSPQSFTATIVSGAWRIGLWSFAAGSSGPRFAKAAPSWQPVHRASYW